MLTFILLLLISFTCLPILNAQTIFEHSDNSSYVFKYVPYERNVNNKVLNQLALAHLKVPERTSFSFSYRYRTSLKYSQNDSLYLYIDFTPLGYSGDVQIRNYSIEKLLEPSEYEIIYTLNSADGRQVLQERKRLMLDDGIMLAGAFPDSLWEEGMTLDLEIAKIHFSESDYRNLELELVAIRDYYAAVSLCDTLLKDLKTARKKTNNLNQLVKVYFNGAKGSYLIGQALKAPSEIVPGSDPMGLRERKRLFDYHLNEYADFISSSNHIFLTGDVYLAFAQAYINSLKDAQLLSQKVDYYSSPFFYKLYSNSITPGLLERMGSLVSAEVKRRGVEDYDEKRLLRNIFLEYQKESNRLISESRNVEAIDLLTGAAKIANLTIFNYPAGEMESALNEARKGLVLSYATIIQRALDLNMITLAEKYMAEASNYTDKFGIENNETSQFREIYVRMAGIRIRLGNNMLQSGNYNSALNEFISSIELLNGENNYLKKQAEDGKDMAVRFLYNDLISKVESFIDLGSYEMASQIMSEAEQFAQSYSSFYIDKHYADSLKGQIAQIKFNTLVNAIINRPDYQSESETVAIMAQASELEHDFKFQHSPVFDSLIMKLGYPYVNQLFSRGRLKHWASEPDSAMFIARQSIGLAKQLQIDNHPNVVKQYNELLEMSSETYCNQAKGKYNSLMSEIRELFAMNKIIVGVNKSKDVREHIYSYSGCGLNTTELNALLDDYRHLIRWQNLVTEAFDKLEHQDYQLSSDLIQQAESIYSFYKLDTMGLANIGYYDLALKSDDISMLRYAVIYLINKAKPDEALTVLERLQKAGYPAKEANDLQETLARNLANRDKSETKDLNVKVMLKVYTGGNKWYERFESVYKYYTQPDEKEGVIKSIGNYLKF